MCTHTHTHMYNQKKYVPNTVGLNTSKNNNTIMQYNEEPWGTWWEPSGDTRLIIKQVDIVAQLSGTAGNCPMAYWNYLILQYAWSCRSGISTCIFGKRERTFHIIQRILHNVHRTGAL